MKHDFDTIINRCRTGSVKWDLAEDLFGEKDLLPLWVADMDFESPAPVVDAVLNRARHGIYGYSACMPSYYEATLSWLKKHHNWRVDRSWIVFSPGIIPALNMLVQTFSDPGDGVIIQPPVYYPFMQAVSNNQRRIISSPLRLQRGKYVMNFEDLEKKAADPGAKLLILCSPHNPVGRVWTAGELEQLGAICRARGLLVVSDEIHADLTFRGYTHVPFASLSPEFLAGSVTCTSPSKTFNLAGLHTANLIIPDAEKRRRFENRLRQNGILGPNAFGAVALEAAYRSGEPWLEELLDYLQANLEFLRDYIRNRLPEITVIEPEATYLVWLDFGKLGMSGRQLRDRLLKKARVALDEGTLFGHEEGAGFQRINIACPRPVLAKALRRIERALHHSTE